MARALAFDVERLTHGALDDLEPRVSPDGKTIAFRRGRGYLVLLDVESGKESLLVAGWNLSSVSWSPDGQWLAYSQDDDEFNEEVWIVPADGSAEPVNVSQHPDDDVAPRWSAGGRVLTFRASRGGDKTISVTGTRPMKYKDTMKGIEKHLLSEALKVNRYNQRDTANHLSLTYDQLRHALKKHGLLQP